ncbi:MAG: uracil-DNA glycosylase [Candidatus Poribacteria bacterium]|nr:uracil-DNA glycosylase [Candidatus Poribacteria bacterium]
MTEVAIKMDALKAQAIVCISCGLADTRLNVVFGNGDATAKLVIVAEGPSATDEKTTRPFSGPSGELLDDVLHANGLTRDELWLTNVIKCRAAIRKGHVVKNRPPKAAEIKACAKWLDGELTLINPSVILCMGSPAANTLIHKGFRMTEERGRWFTDTLYAPFIMATFNPAFVLRQEGDAFTRVRQTLIDDIAEAKRKLADAPEQPKLTLF